MTPEIASTPLVLLAGGKSERMGTPKGLLKIGGNSWLRHQLGTFFKAGGKDAVVVLGFEAQGYEEELEGFASPRPLCLIRNPQPERGSFSSLVEGLRALVPAKAGAFVLPLDVPAPGSPVWQALLVNSPGADAVIPTHEGRGGHPVWLGPAVIADCLKRDASDRLDLILKGWSAARIQRVMVSDPAVLLNLNTRDEWQAWITGTRSAPNRN